MKDKLDFIVIGAQKAGTTSLFEHLRQHPQICLPAEKELPYFSNDPLFARGWQEYLARLAFSEPERQWGTVTPQYMVGGVYKRRQLDAASSLSYDERTVPLRIRELLPDVRLVAILRDPVERARSHFQMRLVKGFERRSFDQAISELLRPEALERARMQPEESTGYVTWGEYGRILSGYFAVFAPEQILVVFTDELEHSPAQLLARIHDFIGVSADFTPENLDVRHRPGGSSSWKSPHRSSSPQGLKRLMRNSAARAAWRLLPTDSRARVKRDFEHYGFRLDLWSPRRQRAVAQPSPATLERLREHFARDADELATLVGLTPPWREPAKAA